ncbi:MAG: hypothetical protein HY696_05610 [Deltaproteobacteria bacterium]|nr:hypothetical protein [Deltaproteobacteria bacterium]
MSELPLTRGAAADLGMRAVDVLARSDYRTHIDGPITVMPVAAQPCLDVALSPAAGAERPFRLCPDATARQWRIQFQLLTSGCSGRLDGDFVDTGFVVPTDASLPDTQVVQSAPPPEVNIPPEQFQCIDTDERDYLHKGSLSYWKQDHWEIVPDTCKTPNLLQESVCTYYRGGDTAETDLVKFVTCPCAEGRCTEPPIDGCEDPTPETVPAGAHLWTWEQSTSMSLCVGATNIEFITCDHFGQEQHDVLPCPSGETCVAGICGDARCLDSDPGAIASDAGHMFFAFSNGDSSTFPDQCVSATQVKQYQCPTMLTDNVIEEQQRIEDNAIVTDCPDGTTCAAGACSESGPLQCTGETDPDQDPLLPGTVMLPLGDAADWCIALLEGDVSALYGQPLTTSIWQYWCDAGDLQGAPSACPPGTVCVADACQSGQQTCEETDGGSNDPTTHDYVQFLYQGKPVPNSGIFVDQCADPWTSAETYCLKEGGFASYKPVACPDGTFCITDHCHPCTDSDATNAVETLGYVTDSAGQTIPDYCVGPQLIQVDCGPDGVFSASAPTYCPGGTSCDEGICQ